MSDPAPILAVDGISLSFGGLKAVSDFSLRLQPGALHGLIGPNGAGKTTVFNLLTGVYRPMVGTITLNGRRVDGLRPHRIAAAGLARTFQNIRLFAELSVLDNLLVASHLRLRHGLLEAALRLPRFRREEHEQTHRALTLLELLDLAHLAHAQARSLPYGLQRRLEIARALATSPRLLLLDEPAAGMNSQEKIELAGLIRSLRTRFDLTILLIEHDMALVMDCCERITVLDYGKIIAEGTPNEIQTNPDVLEAYLGPCSKPEQYSDILAKPAMEG